MKNYRKILSVIVLLISGYFVYNLYKHADHVEFNDYEPYMWIFKDSVKNDVDTNFVVGVFRERDIIYVYNLKSGYSVSIWEFKDLKEIQLDQIPIEINADLREMDVLPREGLFKNGRPEIMGEIGFSLKGKVNLSLDNNSKIIKTIEGTNYKGFYGIANKLALGYENGKHSIILNYPKGKEPIVFLFYKSSKSFYIIIINARDKVSLDENAIQLLNLS